MRQATCPQLSEDDVVGGPVAHAINLEVAIAEGGPAR